MEKFNALLVKPFDTDNYDWANVDYIHSLLENKNCTNVHINYEKQLMLTDIAKYLEIEKYNDPYITPHIIGFDKDYTYEIIYSTFTPDKENIENIKHNSLGTIIDLQGKEIFGNFLLLKLKTPHTDYTSKYVDLNKKDIVDHLNKRVHTNVIIYEDNEFREEPIPGDTETFAKVVFGDDYCRLKRIEIPFLKHNINIWYIIDEYGDKGVFGKLINENDKVFKGVIFTKITNELRGNLSLDEINKIIFLSNNLNDFILSDDNELVKHKKNNNNINIIKNKFRILETVYNIYKK
jgi:hypothetical protein